jgi:hypothetical protein
MERPQIGQILIAEGAVSEAVLARALGYQRATSQTFRLGSILFNWDLLAEDKLLAALCKLHHCVPATWADLSQATPEALRTFSAAYAVRLGAFPYAIDSKGLHVAFSNPSDLAAIDEISRVSRKRLIPAVATEAALVLAFNRFYGRPVPPPFREVVQKFGHTRIAPAPARATRPVPALSAAMASKAASRASLPSRATMPARQAAPTATQPQPPMLDRVSVAPPAAAPAASPRPEPPRPRGAPVDEPAEARNRARIAVSVVEALLATFPRVLVLGVGRSALSGWTGRGPGLTPEIAASIRVPAAETTVLPEVARTGVPHFGPVKPGQLSLALKGMLDREAPACAALPIRVLGSVAAILYADRLGEPMPEEDLPVLSDAAETAAKLLSKFLLPGAEG